MDVHVINLEYGNYSCMKLRQKEKKKKKKTNMGKKILTKRKIFHWANVECGKIQGKDKEERGIISYPADQTDYRRTAKYN